MKTRCGAYILILISIVAIPFNIYAGDLEPDTGPVPTMKTLGEVEPRIAIPGSGMPVGPYVINSSGSYYLTGDRICSGTGIEVNTNNVTIDLMGYTLTGPETGTSYGIYMNELENVEIRNGTVQKFGSHGIRGSSFDSRMHRIINVRLLYNGLNGISLASSGNLIKDCLAKSNGNRGIYTNLKSIVSGNIVYENQGDGIFAGDNSRVTGNVAYENQANGINAFAHCLVTDNIAYDNKEHGIVAGEGSTLAGNSAYGNDKDGISASVGNTVRGNTAYENAQNGISAYPGSTVTGNTVYYNNQDFGLANAGIYVSDGCLVKGNNARYNFQNNIYINGPDNAIEENLVTYCGGGNGICFNSIGNFYANNRASGNGTNFSGTTGQTDGGGNVGF